MTPFGRWGGPPWTSNWGGPSSPFLFDSKGLWGRTRVGRGVGFIWIFPFLTKQTLCLTIPSVYKNLVAKWEKYEVRHKVCERKKIVYFFFFSFSSNSNDLGENFMPRIQCTFRAQFFASRKKTASSSFSFLILPPLSNFSQPCISFGRSYPQWYQRLDFY